MNNQLYEYSQIPYEAYLANTTFYQNRLKGNNPTFKNFTQDQWNAFGKLQVDEATLAKDLINTYNILAKTYLANIEEFNIILKQNLNANDMEAIKNICTKNPSITIWNLFTMPDWKYIANNKEDYKTINSTFTFKIMQEEELDLLLKLNIDFKDNNNSYLDILRKYLHNHTKRYIYKKY